MRPDRGAGGHLAAFTAVSGAFLAFKINDFPLAWTALLDRLSFGAREAVLHEIIGVIDVFLQIPPHAAVKCFAIDAEQIEPWIFAIEKTIAGHHRAQGAERETVSAKT